MDWNSPAGRLREEHGLALPADQATGCARAVRREHSSVVKAYGPTAGSNAGKVLVGGWISNTRGPFVRNIVRLNDDGLIDYSFGGTGADSPVHAANSLRMGTS
ncbi:MAG: hypothetical protein CMO80_04060 [Verrucomicrobiales bacterium]|nr:hypothetical protein [Verrucomicrobiales bacterium]